KGDLVINGSGSLRVEANYNNGIASKDDLRIVSGMIEVHAADDALVGKDVLAIADGTFILHANGDAMKSTNDKDEGRGNIVIEGGTFELNSGSAKAMKAATDLWIT